MFSHSKCMSIPIWQTRFYQNEANYFLIIKSHYFSNEKIYNCDLRSVEDKLPENLLISFVNGSFSIHQINKDIPTNCKIHTQI